VLFVLCQLWHTEVVPFLGPVVAPARDSAVSMRIVCVVLGAVLSDPTGIACHSRDLQAGRQWVFCFAKESVVIEPCGMHC
jgi:hypothetical protein